ncbi:hypothetical protein V6Z11_D05G084600 [Gossypium hirsutum]|uniref:Uncharacterized protein isoform X3 n=1 Tax=Gossypium hirsutum TaxID=3635 RepID=A0A1U8JG00_GOSHI|nr:uncharacterized protein LOC107906686 isoform X3 [Gossypium hirsutum]
MIWICLGLSMESKIRFFNQTARWFPACLATKLKPGPLPANPIYNNCCLYNNTQQPRLAIFHNIPISYSFTASAARKWSKRDWRNLLARDPNQRSLMPVQGVV